MRNLLPWTLILFLLSGCAANLQPAPEAEDVPFMEEAARSSVDGVEVIAQAGDWPGEAAIAEAVTPIHVILENRGEHPLRVTYDTFALIAPTGKRFSALPPFKIEGEVEEPVVGGGYSTFEPAYGYSGFDVAPHYRSVYPGLTPYGRPFPHDPYYYGPYYRRWRSVELPTDEMLRRALPEGVLKAGGRMEGYLYFEKVSDDVKRVSFRADLVRPETGARIGEIRIPFTVE